MATNHKSVDLQMMELPAAWPQWPMLPVKKKGEAFQPGGTGILFADGKPIIYLINMWKVGSKEDLLKAEKLTFTDLQAIVDAGWVVD